MEQEGEQWKVTHSTQHKGIFCIGLINKEKETAKNERKKYDWKLIKRVSYSTYQSGIRHISMAFSWTCQPNIKEHAEQITTARINAILLSLKWKGKNLIRRGSIVS